MTLEIEIAGRSRIVSVEPVAGDSHRFCVTLDGRPEIVDAIRLGDGVLSLILPKRGHRSYEVGVTTGPVRGDLVISVGKSRFTARIDGRRSARPSEPDAGPAGTQRVVAPMPGKVVRVQVAPGDAVVTRQPLVVVEAMKMENELRSPKNGRVAEVAVTEGMSVEAGRLLVVVE